MAAGRRKTQRGLEKRIGFDDQKLREFELNVDEKIRLLEKTIESLESRISALETP